MRQDWGLFSSLILAIAESATKQSLIAAFPSTGEAFAGDSGKGYSFQLSLSLLRSR